MTDTEWTRYAFTLPGDEEPVYFGSVRSLPCELTIDKGGKAVIALDTDQMLRSGPPVYLDEAQLFILTAKLEDLKENHRG